MTGTGNDFIIFDAQSVDFPSFDRPLLAKTVCRRTLSVGADGVVFLEKPTKVENSFKWDFYNADGSSAEFCGNAARCIARYAYENKIAKRKTSFESAAGIVHTEILQSNNVKVEMPIPQLIERSVIVPVGEQVKVEVTYLNTGVPHVVKLNDDWDQEYLSDMGNYLRHHELFKKTGGANVTFYEVIDKSKIHSATYERGVEGVTMACGTGAVAAATAAVLAGMHSPIEIEVPGGVLHVEIDSNLTFAFLTGEARFICEGNIFSEALL